MTAEDAKRLAEIRAEYEADGNTYAVDVPWLLDQLAARDARIANLESAIHRAVCEGHNVCVCKL